jgi:hypothetical protein
VHRCHLGKERTRSTRLAAYTSNARTPVGEHGLIASGNDDSTLRTPQTSGVSDSVTTRRQRAKKHRSGRKRFHSSRRRCSPRAALRSSREVAVEAEIEHVCHVPWGSTATSFTSHVAPMECRTAAARRRSRSANAAWHGAACVNRHSDECARFGNFSAVSSQLSPSVVLEWRTRHAHAKAPVLRAAIAARCLAHTDRAVGFL